MRRIIILLSLNSVIYGIPQGYLFNGINKIESRSDILSGNHNLGENFAGLSGNSNGFDAAFNSRSVNNQNRNQLITQALPLPSSSSADYRHQHHQLPHQQKQQNQQNHHYQNNQQIHHHHHQQNQQKKPEILVTKRFYIHSAPDDHEEEEEKFITIGTPKKNYNIVFIRAPSGMSKKTALNIIPAAKEDRTVIYVLSKKVDGTEIEANVQEQPTTTSKPEVFFIKYKTPEEAAYAQQQIQAQYDSLGGTSHVSDEGIAPITSVIGSSVESDNHDQSSQSEGSTDSQNPTLYHNGQTNTLSNNGYLPPNFV